MDFGGSRTAAEALPGRDGRSCGGARVPTISLARIPSPRTTGMPTPRRKNERKRPKLTEIPTNLAGGFWRLREAPVGAHDGHGGAAARRAPRPGPGRRAHGRAELAPGHVRRPRTRRRGERTRPSYFARRRPAGAPGRRVRPHRRPLRGGLRARREHPARPRRAVRARLARRATPTGALAGAWPVVGRRGAGAAREAVDQAAQLDNEM